MVVIEVKEAIVVIVVVAPIAEEMVAATTTIAVVVGLSTVDVIEAARLLHRAGEGTTIWITFPTLHTRMMTNQERRSRRPTKAPKPRNPLLLTKITTTITTTRPKTTAVTNEEESHLHPATREDPTARRKMTTNLEGIEGIGPIAPTKPIDLTEPTDKTDLTDQTDKTDLTDQTEKGSIVPGIITNNSVTTITTPVAPFINGIDPTFVSGIN